MPQGGVLTVALVADVGQKLAEIRVQDTGTGIAPEHLARLFQPFFTTKQADEKGQGGNGLGLSLCRDVMQSHGGSIRAESELGRGTRFVVTLPLESLEAPLSPAAAVLQQRAQQRPALPAAVPSTTPTPPPAPKGVNPPGERRRAIRSLGKPARE